MTAANIRESLYRVLPLAVFLAAYFFLTVAGNLLYTSDLISTSLERVLPDPSNMPKMHDAAFWLLLALPFVAAPIAFAVRRLLAPATRQLAPHITDIEPWHYVLMLAACYGFVVFSFWRADVLALAWVGNDVFSSVRARFEILDRLGFWARMALQSPLVFLTIYSYIRALKSRRALWIVASVINIVSLATLMVSLNMKWPMMTLCGALTLSVFFNARARPLLSAAAMAVASVGVYLVVSVAVLRLAPPLESVRHEIQTPSSGARPLNQYRPDTGGVLLSSAENAPFLLLQVINRMALPVPYYYATFSREGPICGTIVDRILRKTNPCQPSNLIYEKMYGEDEFAGIGTAPAAVHITGYALGGWPGALVEITLTMIVLGAFMALPVTSSATAATIGIMGGLAGYFFSQLPFEGPIVYDHGILWWGLMISAYLLFRYLKQAKRPAGETQAKV
ncbi:MAG: hypothetical protein AB7K64_12150 [Variibacter sp.]